MEDALRTKRKTEKGVEEGKELGGRGTEKLKWPTLFTVIVPGLGESESDRGKGDLSLAGPFVKLKFKYFP